MDACTLGLVKWTTSSSLKMFTSSMPGMTLTPRRLRVFVRRLSSVEVVLCRAFFFLCGLNETRGVMVSGCLVGVSPIYQFSQTDSQ